MMIDWGMIISAVLGLVMVVCRFEYKGVFEQLDIN